jgi:hypothetical protein
MAKSAKLNYSNKLVNARAPKTEPKPKAVNPGGAAQIGGAQAKPRAVEPLYGGAGYRNPVGPTSTLVCGPKGQGRTVSRCGSQGQHGSPNYGLDRTAKQITTEMDKSIPLDQKRTNKTVG